MDVTQQSPLIPAVARANRAFVLRAVRFAASTGIRQFLDIGSGIPTEDNVHEFAPGARVIYVDTDPAAVSEGLEILSGNQLASSIQGDLRDPKAILAHRDVRRLIDFDEPVAILLCAVLPFLPDDAEADRAVAQLRSMACPDSALIISHSSPGEATDAQQTTTAFRMRSHAEVVGFFDGFELADPGLVWVPQWRPDASDPSDFVDDPSRSSVIGGVAIRRYRGRHAAPARAPRR